MNERQKAAFDRTEKRLKECLTRYENDELALSLIEYNPKKDGTARQNFADNFAIRGLGTALKYPSGYSCRRVEVKPVTYNGYKGSTVICLDISVLEIEKPEDMQKAGIDRPVKHVNDERFAFSVFSNFEDMPTDTTAEQYVKVIHEKIIPGIRAKQELIKQELAMLPEMFNQFILMGNMYNKLEKETEGSYLLKYALSDLVKAIPDLHD